MLKFFGGLGDFGGGGDGIGFEFLEAAGQGCVVEVASQGREGLGYCFSEEEAGVFGGEGEGGAAVELGEEGAGCIIGAELLEGGGVVEPEEGVDAEFGAEGDKFLELFGIGGHFVGVARSCDRS